ncbi:YnbE family lipoprotein [Desulfosarcina sp. OttesenSCG-928-A07]|nr:YnbE family lipoprotein [Desulfosarcina sp. OttesenSCG-928-A07]
MKRWIGIMCALSLLGGISACVSAHHEVDVRPVEIKPIHITIDVNVKVDRALDDFFGDIDEAAEEIKASP